MPPEDSTPHGYDGTMEMNHDDVRLVGNDVGSLKIQLQTMKGALDNDPLEMGHLGGSSHGGNAYNAYHAAVQAMSQSLVTATTYLGNLSTLIIASADSTKELDVENSWGLQNADGGE